ncbi:astacin [Ostertagia ostertagi]
MHKLQKDLGEYEGTLDIETSLSEEQIKLLERLKSSIRKIHIKSPHKENTIERVNTESGIIDALFQGDMVLSKEQQDEVMEDFGGGRFKRQADNDRTHPERKWSNGVSYSLDGSLDERAKAAFKKAAELWMKDTCIDFEEDSQEEAEDLLLVYKEHGCWAEVGRQGGWQLLSLGESYCETAPKGGKIEIEILQTPQSHLGGCPHAGVEIKTHSDQRLTGYR